MLAATARTKEEHPSTSGSSYQHQQQSQSPSFFGRLLDLPKWVPTVDSLLQDHERRLSTIENALQQLPLPLPNNPPLSSTFPNYLDAQLPSSLLPFSSSSSLSSSSSSSTTQLVDTKDPSLLNSTGRPSRKRTRKYVPPPSTNELVMLTKPIPGFCPPDLQEAVRLAADDPTAREMMRKNNKRFVIPPEYIPQRYINNPSASASTSVACSSRPTTAITSKHFLNICTGCGFTATSKYFVKKHKDLVPYCNTRHGASPTGYQAILDDLSTTIQTTGNTSPAFISHSSSLGSSSSASSSTPSLSPSPVPSGGVSPATSFFPNASVTTPPPISPSHPSSSSSPESIASSSPPEIEFLLDSDMNNIESFLDYNFLQDTQEFVRLLGEPIVPIGSIVKLLRVENGLLLATRISKQVAENGEEDDYESDDDNEEEEDEEEEEGGSRRRGGGEGNRGQLFAVVADPSRCSSDRSKMEKAIKIGLLPITSNGISKVQLADNRLLTEEEEQGGKPSSYARVGPLLIAIVSSSVLSPQTHIKTEYFVAKLVPGRLSPSTSSKVLGYIGVALSEPAFNSSSNTWSVEAFCIPDVFGARTEGQLFDSLNQLRSEMLTKFEAMATPTKSLSSSKPLITSSPTPSITDSGSGAGSSFDFERKQLLLQVLQEQTMSTIRNQIDSLVVKKRSKQLDTMNHSLAKYKFKIGMYLFCKINLLPKSHYFYLFLKQN
jgi:hypothetical protein